MEAKHTATPVYCQNSHGGTCVGDSNAAIAKAAGAQLLHFGDRAPDSAIVLYRATSKTFGIKRDGKHIRAFRDFDRALRAALAKAGAA